MVFIGENEVEGFPGSLEHLGGNFDALSELLFVFLHLEVELDDLLCRVFLGTGSSLVEQ